MLYSCIVTFSPDPCGSETTNVYLALWFFFLARLCCLPFWVLEMIVLPIVSLLMSLALVAWSWSLKLRMERSLLESIRLASASMIVSPRALGSMTYYGSSD